MPVADNDLEQRIEEIAAGDANLKKLLLENLGANPEVKARFVNSTLGRADVTRKQQEIAEEKKKLAREQETFQAQLADYQTKLSQADLEKDEVMRQLADKEVSLATANARLLAIKNRWQLSDEDLPTPAEVQKTATTGKVVDSTDIDKRFEQFKTSLLTEIQTKLMPEMGALAELPRVMANIESEHDELFGKRMTKADRNELMKLAKDERISITDAWEKKFGVPEKRRELDVKKISEDAIKKYEEDRVAKETERALRGVPADESPFHRGSPLLQKKFEPKSDVKVDESKYPAPATSAVERDGRSGASRARERYTKFVQSGGQSEGISVNRGPQKVA